MPLYRNSKRCPPDVAAKFNSSISVRTKLFNDWMYNDRSTKTLAVLYERVAVYRQVTLAVKTANKMVQHTPCSCKLLELLVVRGAIL